MTRATSLLAAAVGLLATADSVLASPKVVSFPFTKSKRSPDQPGLARRAGTVQASLTNAEYLFLINITIGTPPQSVAVQLDTGSSDLWVPDGSTKICKTSPGGCLNVGVYNPSSSTSEVVISSSTAFNISYVDGSNVAGAYINETVHIGSTAITDMTMGLASTGQENSALTGIMGVGYISDEALASTEGLDGEYPNIVSQLKDQGYINSLSYSLYLDSLTSPTGSILFGGIDTSRYLGQLTSLPVIPGTRESEGGGSGYTDLAIALTGVAINNGAAALTQLDLGATALAAVLDSGTSFTYLPDALVNDVYKSLGVLQSSSLGYYLPCSVGDNEATFVFTFGGTGGPMVNVTLDEFIIPLTDDKGNNLTMPNSKALACQIGIQPMGDSPLLLGDTFLRSAYVVYDLDLNEIAIANTNFNPGASNLVEIGASAIPSAVANTATFGVTNTATAAIQTLGATGKTTGAAGATVTSGSAAFTLGPATGSAYPRASSVAVKGPVAGLSAVISGTVVLGMAMLGGFGFLLM